MKIQLPMLALAGALSVVAPATTAEVTASVFSRYQGTWTLVIERPDAPQRVARTIENACSAAGRFYICEQRSGNAPPSALIFAPTEAAGVFRSTVLASDGTFQQSGTVRVSGPDWEYPWEEKDSSGGRHFLRVINAWVDDAHILYRKEGSLDGRQWRVLESGEEWKDEGQGTTSRHRPAEQRAPDHDRPAALPR